MPNLVFKEVICDFNKHASSNTQLKLMSRSKKLSLSNTKLGDHLLDFAQLKSLKIDHVAIDKFHEDKL